jgi:hypothetical protein
VKETGDRDLAVIMKTQGMVGDPAVLTLLATREGTSDFHARQGTPQTPPEGPDRGLNLVLLIQVPLKQKEPRGTSYDCSEPMMGQMVTGKCAAPGMENAVIGHGKVEGPFTEVANLDIERDPAFPIRVTVQFYKATEDGAVD